MLPNGLKIIIQPIIATLVLWISGCASAMYTPDESTLQRMTPAEARKMLADIPTTAYGRSGVLLSRYGGNTDQAGQVLKVKEVGGRDLTINGVNSKLGSLFVNGKVAIPLREISVTAYSAGMTASASSQGWLKINEYFLGYFKYSDAQKIAEAIFVLKKNSLASARQQQESDISFDNVVQTYHNAATKPAFPENARMFKVQAEGALQDKNFDDAVDLYEEALKLAPWWPEGHFNRALVLAEIGEFDTAIKEMKRYLRLVPEAADARAAQDRIYVWESKTHR